MSSGGAEAGVKYYQAVVVAVRIGCGVDVYGGSGGGTDRGVGGHRQDRDGDGISQRGDNVAHGTLGTEPNARLAYPLVLEHRHPIISMLEDPEGQLEREIDIDR